MGQPEVGSPGSLPWVSLCPCSSLCLSCLPFSLFRNLNEADFPEKVPSPRSLNAQPHRGAHPRRGLSQPPLPWSWGPHPGWPRLGLLWLQFSLKSEQDPNT